jgi:hypothetical protein
MHAETAGCLGVGGGLSAFLCGLSIVTNKSSAPWVACGGGLEVGNERHEVCLRDHVDA